MPGCETDSGAISYPMPSCLCTSRCMEVLSGPHALSRLEGIVSCVFAWQDRPNHLRLQHLCLEAGLRLSLQHLGIEVFCPACVLASDTGRSRRLRLQHFCFEFEKPSRLVRLQHLHLVKNTAQTYRRRL